MNGFFSWIKSGTKEQQNKKRYTAYALAAVAALLVICLLTLAIMGIVTSIRNKKAANEPEETVDPTRGYVTTTFAEGQLNSGDLILVDEAHPYVGTETFVKYPAKNAPERPQTDNNTVTYSLYDSQAMELTQDAMNAFNEMAKAFYAESKDDNLYVYSRNANTGAYLDGRTIELKYYVNFNEDKTNVQSIKEDERYDWIYNNAYKYGFVQLYSAPEANTAEGAEEATDMTNVFRYVGTVHSNLMKDKKCETLTEYLELLKTKTSFKTHLRVSVDKVSYEVYYLAAAGELLIPEKYKDSYTVSGNNIDGYIVTVCTTTSK